MKPKNKHILLLHSPVFFGLVLFGVEGESKANIHNHILLLRRPVFFGVALSGWKKEVKPNDNNILFLRRPMFHTYPFAGLRALFFAAK